MLVTSREAYIIYNGADNIMKLNEKMLNFYMQTAIATANLSHCNRNKVGAILVKNNTIISLGYNGTLPGDDNCCETEFNETKPGVLHAEINAILKISKSNESSDGAIMFCTLSPCLNCASFIVQAGIIMVYYNEIYRDTSGIDLLEKHGVTCIRMQQ